MLKMKFILLISKLNFKNAFNFLKAMSDVFEIASSQEEDVEISESSSSPQSFVIVKFWETPHEGVGCFDIDVTSSEFSYDHTIIFIQEPSEEVSNDLRGKMQACHFHPRDRVKPPLRSQDRPIFTQLFTDFAEKYISEGLGRIDTKLKTEESERFLEVFMHVMRFKQNLEDQVYVHKEGHREVHRLFGLLIGQLFLVSDIFSMFDETG